MSIHNNRIQEDGKGSRQELTCFLAFSNLMALVVVRVTRTVVAASTTEHLLYTVHSVDPSQICDFM